MRYQRFAAVRGAASRQRAALTLAELAVVLVILVALAGILVPMLSNLQVNVGNASDPNNKSPKQIATEATLQRLRETIVGAPNRPGYWNDLLAYSGNPTQSPATLRDLFVVNPALPVALQTFDPTTHRGWRGPYLLNPTGTYTVNATNGFTTTFGATGDPALIDAWGSPIIIQWPTGDPTSTYVRLISAGPNGMIDTALTDLPASSRGDDLVVFLRLPLS